MLAILGMFSSMFTNLKKLGSGILIFQGRKRRFKEVTCPKLHSSDFKTCVLSTAVFPKHCHRSDSEFLVITVKEEVSAPGAA